MRIQTRAIPAWAVLACVMTGVSACDEPQADQAAAPRPQVSVVTLQPSSRPYIRELPGRIAPTRVAEVRARVAGIVLERSFQQGADVKAGDVLYRIDPVRFQVELDAAEAALAKAQAVHDQAEQQAKRVEKLISGQAASQAQYEIAVATFRQAQADVAARKADVARVKLDLDYTSVRSPINGRIGRALVTEGALVGQGEATHLATVHQLDPVYADFTQSAGDLQQLRRDLESGALEQVEPDAAKVRLVLDDGTLYPLAGKLLFSDASVDPGTGQVTLRGEFPNPKGELLPACMCASRSSRAPTATRSQSRNRRCSATTPAAARSMWFAPTTAPSSSRCAPAAWSTSSGWCSTGSTPAIAWWSKAFRNSNPATS